jgi:type I restriction enzyme S subunit
LLRVRINDRIISHLYFLHLFRSPFFQKLLIENSTGSAINNVKGVKDLKAIPIPLPPLHEQPRIVARVEQLMSLCDELEAGLVRSQADSERLMEAVVGRMLAGESK